MNGWGNGSATACQSECVGRKAAKRKSNSTSHSDRRQAQAQALDAAMAAAEAPWKPWTLDLGALGP